jgi:hypothetical protein
MNESKRRQKQAKQGASLAYSKPLKTIVVLGIAGIGLLAVLAFALTV